MDIQSLLRGAMYPQTPTTKPAAYAAPRSRLIFDSASEEGLDALAEHETRTIRMQAAAAVQQWVEEVDLDAGESSADRLLALMVGIADENQDGELDEDEQEVLLAALEAAWDYLAEMGVEEDDISALLNDWDGDAGERVRDLVASAMPEGEDEADEAIERFAFTDEDQEPALDATYRKKVVVRAGKKVRINKRVSGTVRLSGKQKLAIRKASMKARSAGAKARRLKSMKLRRKLGL